MRLINTGREPFFEDVVDHMAAICSVPIAVVSLAGAGRQWINGRHGGKGHEAAPGDMALAHGLLGRRAAVVAETAAPIPLAPGEPVRAFISVPLLLDGEDVGNLYLADTKARAWTSFETSYMDRSSRLVAGHFEARAALAERDRRIEVERQLAEAAAMNRAILGSMQEGMVVQAEGGLIIASNPAARAILGLSEDQLHGRTSIDPRWRVTDLSGAPLRPEDHPANRTIDTGVAQLGVVVGVERPGGERRWVRVNAVPLALAREGGPPRVVTTFSDITDELQQRRRLDEALKAAEAASAAKSSFLANMSHELRTPLNGVLGMAQVLEHASLTKEQHGYVATILDSGKTLMALLNDVLDLSKIEAGRFDIVPTDGCIRDVMAAQINLWKPRAQEKGLDLSLSIDADLPDRASFDHTRVQQCFSNIVSNAIKFTERGRIDIRVSGKAQPEAPALVTVRVSDTGPGMDEDTLSRLFRPFTQADETISRRHGGTGLGLSITRRLAELMGGSASAVSTLGQGSTFEFSFMAAPARSVPAAGPDARETAPLRTGRQQELRVLLVDDHPINRQVASIFLRSMTNRIVTAVNGVEALAALEREPFDIVLLDMHMPVMDGPTTIREMRRSARPWATTPVIALTADAMAGDRERFLAMGMDGYLSKPLDERALLVEVERLTKQGRPALARAG